MRHFCIIGIMSFVITSVSHAAEDNNYLYDESNESEMSSLIQEINNLSKKNEQLKQRISREISKQNDIITKILNLTSNVDLRFGTDVQFNNGDIVTIDDFNYVDDSLLRKCNGITRDYYNNEDLQRRTYIKNLYDTEDIDSDWTEEVSEGINEHIADRFPNTEVLSIQCKTSICEINLKHENDYAKNDFEVNFDPNNKWNIIDSQNENDMITGGNFISIQIARDGKSVSMN